MTKIIGIMNYRSESFSDARKYNTLNRGIYGIKKLFVHGADIVDIGAIATSYGTQLKSSEEEWDILSPLLNNINKKNISIDTCHNETIQKALNQGIRIINDETGGSNPKTLDLIAAHQEVKYICMFSLVLPADTKIRVRSINEIYDWGYSIKEKARKHGVDKQLILDPGIGFTTNTEQSWMMIKNIANFKKIGAPVCLGHSRKSFIINVSKSLPNNRDIETLALSLYLQQQGIDYIRVHNVQIHKKALSVYNYINSVT